MTKNSKGSLLIDFVLAHFVAELGNDDHPYFETLRIVTLGAVADLPAKFRHRRQFLGSIDWLGALNSRRGIEHELVEGAWHHLNPAIPCYMPAETILSSVGLHLGS